MLRSVIGLVLLCWNFGYFGNSVYAWFGKVWEPSEYKGLNATSFLSNDFTEDVAGIKWLKNELGGLEIGSWLEPRGGYFISFDSLPGCAKAIVAKAKEAGVVMTDAGATFPYGKDPQDSNILIAPSYPTPEELKTATEIFVLSVKLVSIDKILEDK